jgi:AraC family ethanolamine operon transcriptional activator
MPDFGFTRLGRRRTVGAVPCSTEVVPRKRPRPGGRACAYLAERHARFLLIRPRVELCGQISFRHLRCPRRKADAIPEMRALSWEWFLRLYPSNRCRLCWGLGTMQVGKLQSGDDGTWPREPLMLLQTLSTRNFDELADGFRRWDLRFRQLGGGPFRGELQSLRLGGVQIDWTSCNCRLLARGSAPPGSFGFAPVLPQNEGALWRGRRCQAGQVVTIDPSQECDHLTAADYEFLALTVDGDLFRQCAAVLGRFDAHERLAGRLALTPSPACCRGLTAHLRELLDRVAARPDLFARPRARQAVEQECVRRVVAAMAQSSGGARSACWSGSRERLVRRADDYLRACLAEPLSVFDLCRELGVSERTLHYAFQQVRGLSPMAYFRACRLNAVRQELKASRAGTATVREVAKRWGFGHPGEFAAAYRRLFGELPSQTLTG